MTAHSTPSRRVFYKELNVMIPVLKEKEKPAVLFFKLNAIICAFITTLAKMTTYERGHA